VQLAHVIPVTAIGKDELEVVVETGEFLVAGKRLKRGLVLPIPFV